jgi:HEAT repeat protein
VTTSFRSRALAVQAFLLTLGSLAVGQSAFAQRPQFLGKDPYHWIDQLKDRSPSARRAAAFALGKLGTATYMYRGFKPLAEHVGQRETDAEVRDAAAYALGELGLALRKHHTESATVWEAAGDALVQALSQDKDPRVRRSAAYAIGGFGRFAASARDALRTALRADSPGVRQNAAWALGQLGNEGAVETLRDLSTVFADGDAQVRRDAAAAVGEIGRLRGSRDESLPNPAIVPLLELLKKEKDATVRKVAVDTLVNAVTSQDKEAAADLRGLLTDNDPDIARGAALALGNIGGADADEAVRVLQRVLADGDRLSRIQASAALANIGEGAAPAIPELVRALDDKDAEIRRNAAFALSRIGSKAAIAIPVLARHLHLDETNKDVRKFCAEALEKMNGDELVPVVPDLIRAIQKDKAAEVRQRCVWALFPLRDPEGLGIVEPLTVVLSETDREQALVRYDSARYLGLRLRGKAPKKAVDVLVEMLKDDRLREYKGTGADVTGSSVEGAKGGATVAMNLGGDARFLAAQALFAIGAPRADRPDVIKALEEAAKSPDKQTQEWSKKALEAIRRKK